ncbi:MAG TPA: GTPase ObgE [Aquificaceae bacterium]|nr:GTPase ObgE [Aquificaceae bacterium]
MKFVDEAEIYVKAGDGGRGCVSFRRERFIPKGGPDGGDGGKGGDIVILGTRALSTLLDFRYKRTYRAENGKGGSGQNKKGRDGKSLFIYVPVGTLILDKDSHKMLADIVTEEGLVIAKGGKGGRGNAHFASPTHRAPTEFEYGESGEEMGLYLVLKLIADMGIVGLPNSGKSTLISRLTDARPKTGNYPFTTLTPNLGVFDGGEKRLVIADMPGLIDNASGGKGLGIQFLRHIERTKLLLHLIDISDTRDQDPIKAFEIVNKEMESYSQDLMKKPQIVVGTKLDALSDRSYIEVLEKEFGKRGYTFIAISAITGENLDRLKYLIVEKVKEIKDEAFGKVQHIPKPPTASGDRAG